MGNKMSIERLNSFFQLLTVAKSKRCLLLRDARRGRGEQRRDRAGTGVDDEGDDVDIDDDGDKAMRRRAVDVD